MMSVTFKAKTKKSRPSLGPGLKKVSRRAVTKTLTRTQCQVDPDTRKPIRYLSAQWQHNNVRTTFQRPFSDTTVLILSRQMSVLTKHQPEHNDRRSETSDNQSAIYPLKDTTTTWEKRSKDCFPDVMELTLSRKTPVGRKTTYCFVNSSGCVQWQKTNNLDF